MNVPADALRVIDFLMQKTPTMIAYWDQDLRCRYANGAYRTWFGVDPEKMIGTTLMDLLGPELFALNETFARGALAGQEQTFERVVPGPDGVRRNSLAKYMPDIQNGVVQGFVVTVTEITQLKQLEEALARETAMRKDIEQRAQELSNLLVERSEMLDVLAHEVRQPLNNASAALQSAQAALVSVAPGGLMQRLERAQSVLQQVRSSIDNTLAAAALLAGPGKPNRIDMDIDTFVQMCIQDLGETDQARVRVDRQTATRTASMDLGLMRLALRNLLLNAVRHSPSGSPIVVRLADSDDPLALLIDVIDQGTGFDPQVLPHLFERGVQGRHCHGGRGLGLYLVHRILEMHGGQTCLLQHSAAGSTVRMILPPQEDE